MGCAFRGSKLIPNTISWLIAFCFRGSPPFAGLCKMGDTWHIWNIARYTFRQQPCTHTHSHSVNKAVSTYLWHCYFISKLYYSGHAVCGYKGFEDVFLKSTTCLLGNPCLSQSLLPFSSPHSISKIYSRNPEIFLTFLEIICFLFLAC